MKKSPIYWFAVLVLAILPTAVSAQTYEGNIDRADKGGIHGWLANPVYPNDSSFYEVWGEFTNPETNKTESCYIGGYLTLVERTDVNAYLGVGGKHGFYLPATSCMYGKMVTIRVYGYDWEWDWWYEVQYLSGQPGHSIVRADDDVRGTVTGKLVTARGSRDLFDSFAGGLYPQVTLLRMVKHEELGYEYLSYESYQNQSTGNCYVQKNVFNCWEGWGRERELQSGDYRLEISANGMQLLSQPFRYDGGNLNFGDLVLIPHTEMIIRQTIDLGRKKVIVIEVEHWEDKPIEVCGVVRGRGVNTYDANVPFGCQIFEKGKHGKAFQLDVPEKFAAGMWVSYKFTMQPVGNPWEIMGELWGNALIER
ncbi:MAG: hypothetical protein V4690_04020 [Patescibacteria group bacterium]